VNTRDLHFYHGTSAAAAVRILSIGARNVIDEMGWRSLASDIYSALLSLGLDEVRRHLLQDKDLLEGPGLSPLRSAAAREEGHRFIYGPFFVTPHIGDAYRYAVRNPVRSELLRAIDIGLKLLTRYGADQRALELVRRYPEVMELINNPPPPVVLELAGIDEVRLSTETGDRSVRRDIERYLALSRLPGAVASFRVDDVIPSDVITIHDLSDWSAAEIRPHPWRRDDDRVRAACRDPQEWLARAQ
jgi:hypothetical protein